MPLPSVDLLEQAALSIVVFGPGFGESIVLRATTAEGPSWAVIDSARKEWRGSSFNPALALLNAVGGRPSLVILTHPHADHTAGLTDIVEIATDEATIGCVEAMLERPSPYAPDEDPDDKAAGSRSQTQLAIRAINRAWRDGAGKVSLIHGGEPLTFAGWTLSVLHPDQQAVDHAVERFAGGRDVSLNDLSASLLVERDDVALVLGADCERTAWTAIEARMAPADLLHARPVKVPHHGSLKAIHPVLIDHNKRADGRPQIVTPFPNSGRLPRFDADQGVDRLLAAAGRVELTAMPVDLVATTGTASVSSVREALIANGFEGDEALNIRSDQPPGTSVLSASGRDPRECWVHMAVDLDGNVEITRGDHALSVTE
jgi:beta-lactamase superfamily II metal-dependent hydrolase